MRAPAILSATILGVLALFLASCTLEPHTSADQKKMLNDLKGPDTGSIERSFKEQAEQATQLGDFKHAAQLYKQLVDKFPDKTEYKLGLAESLRRAGDNNTSLRYTDEVLAKDPNNAQALENKGLALMNTGEFAEAGISLGKVMKVDPKRWRTLNGIGILFAMKGKYDGAMAYFQAALTVSTDNPSVLNNAALTYAIDRQFDRAYEAFARAKRHLEPGSAEMKHLDLNLALVYAVDGKLDDAEQTAAPHLSKEGLYNNMGFYSYLAKNNEMAKTYLNMALTQSPTYYERAWKNMGALTGDNSGMQGENEGEGQGQAMPLAGASGGVNRESNGKLPMPTSGTSSPGPDAGIPLGDIPESKPLHSDNSSPYAGSDAPAAQPIADAAKEDKAAADKAAKKAAKEAAKKKAAEEKVAKKAAKEKAKQEAAAKAAEEGADAPADKSSAAPAPQINPDVILLKKPDAGSSDAAPAAPPTPDAATPAPDQPKN